MRDSPSRIARSLIVVWATWVLFTAGGCSLFRSPEDSSVRTQDRAIEDQIRAAVSLEPQSGPEAFQVHSVRGVVELTGRVKSVAIKSRIGLVAAATAGVVQVRNDLLVVADTSQ